MEVSELNDMNAPTLLFKVGDYTDLHSRRIHHDAYDCECGHRKKRSAVHSIDPETGEMVNKPIKRTAFLEYFANRKPCLIGM